MSVNWKGLLGGIAPILTKAITEGPTAAAAQALGTVSKALLGHDRGNEAQVAAALAGATPEQIEKLRQLEQEFALKLVDSAVQLERLENEDRASARAREIATHDRMPAILAVVLTTGLFGAIWMLARVQIPAENREPLMLLVGSLGTTWGAAMAYYHGSSSSSRAKDVVLGKMAGK